MKPSDETIEKFKDAYFKEFGEEISREDAYEKFLRLTNFLRVILRSIPPEIDLGPENAKLKKKS